MVDTSVLISRLLLPDSIPARAVSYVVEHHQLLASDDTMNQLADVLARPKFDAYITIAERQEFLRLLLRVVEWVPVTCSIQACRDPKDNKFLELAVSGNALTILTGDKDLLALDPFHSLRILRPAEFLDQAHAIRGPE